jgi:hypothetical protein
MKAYKLHKSVCNIDSSLPLPEESLQQVAPVMPEATVSFALESDI